MLKYALIPLLPFTGFLIAGLFGKYLKEKAAYFPIAGVLGAFLPCRSAPSLDVLGGTIINENLYSWISIGNFTANVGFQIDQLTAVMLMVVTTLSSLIHIYSVGYMHGDKGYPRFFAYLALFTFFMLVLVMANNFLLMFVGWEGVGLCSYLLIGFWYEKKSASDAGVKAFVVNRVGDFGFVLGMLLIFVTFGSLQFTEVFKAVATPAANVSYSLLGGEISVITLIALLLFLGATGKSAQLPLYVWLPDAMEGPTPVSALIHAATMVTAGVFMVARCAPIFSLSETAMNTVAIVGALDGRLCRNHRPGPERHQAGHCLFDHQPAGVHVPRPRRRGLLGRHLPSHDACLLQRPPVPRLGQRDPRAVRRAGHAQDGGAQVQRSRSPGRYSLSEPWRWPGIPPFAGFFSKDEILWSAYNSPSDRPATLVPRRGWCFHDRVLLIPADLSHLLR